MNTINHQRRKHEPSHHGLVHVMNIINFAITLGDLLNLDEHTLYLIKIACAVHDFGYHYSEENHAKTSSQVIRNYKDQYNLSDEDIELICFAVENHGGKHESNYHNIVSSFVIIADKLDVVNKILHSAYKENQASCDRFELEFIDGRLLIKIRIKNTINMHEIMHLILEKLETPLTYAKSYMGFKEFAIKFIAE